MMALLPLFPGMRMPSRASFLSRVVDGLTLLVLGVAIFLLLESRLGRRDVAGTGTHPATLQALPAIAARDSVGAPVNLRSIALTTGTPTLLYLFRSDCPACMEQRDGWREAAASARRAGWQIVAITPEALTPSILAYFESEDVHVLRSDDPLRLFSDLRSPGVPTTIAADGSGTVRFHRLGVLDSIHTDSLHRILHDIGTGRSRD